MGHAFNGVGQPLLGQPPHLGIGLLQLFFHQLGGAVGQAAFAVEFVIGPPHQGGQRLEIDAAIGPGGAAQLMGDKLVHVT